jgi:hypothetical protein
MTIHDETCAWCGEPATMTIELEPVQMGTRRHPVSGQQVRVPIQRAKTAGVCEAHADVRDRTGGVQMHDPRKSKATVQQLDIYDALNEEAA